jgi:DNA-binding IclR family transcriptional regulator
MEKTSKSIPAEKPGKPLPKAEKPPKNLPKSESIALRAFSLLEYIVKAEGPVSLDEVTRGCDLPKPTAFRILEMLREAAMLQRDPEGKRFVVGPRLSLFAFDVIQHSIQRTECHNILKDLVDKIGETCNITMLDGNEVLYLDRVETQLPLRLSLSPGTRVPLHCTASGKLFLSRMSPRQIQRLLGKAPLARYTDKTITDLDVLLEELKVIRQTRIGTYDSEIFNDSISIAVPIGGSNKRIYMAVAVHGPASRMTLPICMERFLPVMRDAAAAITEILLPVHELPDQKKTRGGARSAAAAPA